MFYHWPLEQQYCEAPLHTRISPIAGRLETASYKMRCLEPLKEILSEGGYFPNLESQLGSALSFYSSFPDSFYNDHKNPSALFDEEVLSILAEKELVSSKSFYDVLSRYIDHNDKEQLEALLSKCKLSAEVKNDLIAYSLSEEKYEISETLVLKLNLSPQELNEVLVNTLLYRVQSDFFAKRSGNQKSSTKDIDHIINILLDNPGFQKLSFDERIELLSSAVLSGHKKLINQLLSDSELERVWL